MFPDQHKPCAMSENKFEKDQFDFDFPRFPKKIDFFGKQSKPIFTDKDDRRSHVKITNYFQHTACLNCSSKSKDKSDEVVVTESKEKIENKPLLAIDNKAANEETQIDNKGISTPIVLISCFLISF